MYKPHQIISLPDFFRTILLLCNITAILFLYLSLVSITPLTSCFAADNIPISAMDRMIKQIRRYGFTDRKVLKAVRNVPRHMFVPDKYRKYSYNDSPLSIGHGQTISQPFIVAEMTRLLDLSGDSKVLEIGTGSGYQAAVLSEITTMVYSVEIVQPLVEFAANNLKRAGYKNVRQRHADGYYGWPETGPFDAIIVTCAAGNIPPPLLKQLAPGGRMIIPVGKRFGTQNLILITKNMEGVISSKNIMPVRFVPLVRK